jgi:hypothetical protein
VQQSKGVSHQIKLGLLALLLLAVATTAVVWPSPGADDDDKSGNRLVRTSAVGIHVADSTTQIQLADLAALDQLARRLGVAIVQGQDGWQCVCGPNVLYWAVTFQPPHSAAAPGKGERAPRTGHDEAAPFMSVVAGQRCGDPLSPGV